jgi:hypothetical protein
MKAILIFCVIELFSILSYAQQFQLETTVERELEAIFDLEGDGICEYVADTNKVYDGATHLLKFTFPNGYLMYNEPQHAQNPNSIFPHIDFNGDGKRDLIIRIDSTVAIYDVVNNHYLFQFGAQGESPHLHDLCDIDGDNELELVMSTVSGSWPNYIYKMYIYSTGVTTSASIEKYTTLPSEYRLEQNFPNPFNPSTTIRYSLSSPEKVSIRIYDAAGQLVKEFNNEHHQAGEYEVIWDGTSEFGQKAASGAYFYQITVDNYSEAKKMILLK